MRGKYGAKKTNYKGVNYDSKKEAEYAWELDQRVRNGEYKSYERQFKLSLDVNGQHITNYLVDFLVTTKTGEKEAHEVKGYQTDVWKIKWKLAQAIYGKEYKFIII